MKTSLRYVISALIAVLFLWLALRDVSLTELRLTVNRLTYYWLVPYVVISLLSHYLRAERWKQLIEQENVKTTRMTLFSGVMLGYLVNYAVPRLGEISRCVYVGNREQLSRSNLLGTVVMERALDLLITLLLVVFVIIYLLSDHRAIVPIIGDSTISLIEVILSLDGILVLGLILVLGILAVYLGYRLLSIASQWIPSLAEFFRFAADKSKKFAKGILSIRKVRNWPVFILLTAGIWFCYVLMTYIPFTAFDLHTTYGLGMQEALVVTVVSALGIILPSPGGIGTYHWFVSRTLLVLFAVPETVGVAYAIVTHLVMMIIILVSAPLLLAVNKINWREKFARSQD